MASKANLNQLAVTALSIGVMDMIIDKYGMCIDLGDYTAMQGARQAAHKALDTLGGVDIPTKDVNRIKRMIEAFSSHIEDRHGNIATITSLAMGLMNDVLDRTKNEKKFRAILSAFAALGEVHQCFDQNFEYHASYADAAELTEKWQAVLEAA